jgi:hypothetical protein
MSQVKLPVRFDDFLHDLILWKLQGDTHNKVLNLSGESLRSFNLFGKQRVAPEGKDLLLNDTVLVDLSHNEINSFDDLFLVAPNTWWLNLAHNQKLNIPIKENTIEDLSLPLAFGSLNFSRNTINMDYLSILVNTHIIRLYISMQDLMLKQRHVAPAKARALVLSKLANVWILNDEYICWEERQFLNSLGQGSSGKKAAGSVNQMLPTPVVVEMTDMGESSRTKKEVNFGKTSHMGGSKLASLFSSNWKVRSSGIKEGQFLTSIQNCSWSTSEDMDCFRLDIALDDYLMEAHLSNEAGLSYVSKGKSFPLFDVQKLFNLPHALQLDLSIIFSAMILVQQVPYSLLLDTMTIMLGPYMTQQEINDLMSLPGFVKTALICTLRRKVMKDYQVLSYQSGKVNQQALPGALFQYDFVSTLTVMEYLKTEPKHYVKKSIQPFSQIEVNILEYAPLIVTPFHLKKLKSVNNAAVTSNTNSMSTEGDGLNNNWYLFICLHTIHLLKHSASFPTVNQMHSSTFEEMVPLIKGAGMNYVDFFSYAEMNTNDTNFNFGINYNNKYDADNDYTAKNSYLDDNIDVGSANMSENEEYDMSDEGESKGSKDRRRSPQKCYLDISSSIDRNEVDEGDTVGDTISGIVGEITGVSLALSEEDADNDIRTSPYNKVIGPQGLSMLETGSVMRQSLRDLKEMSKSNTMQNHNGHYKYYSKKPQSAGGPRRIYPPSHDTIDMSDPFNPHADPKKKQNKVGVYTANNMVDSMFLMSSRNNLLTSKEFNQLEDKSPANLLLHKPPVVMDAYNFEEMANQHAQETSASMTSGEEEMKYGTFPDVTLSNTNNEPKRRDSLDFSVSNSVSTKSTVSLATATRDMLAEMGTLRNIRNMMSPHKLKQNMRKSMNLDLAALNLTKSSMKNKYMGPGGDTTIDNDDKYQDMPFYETKESVAARRIPRVKTTGMLKHIASMQSPVDDVKMKSRYLNVFTEPREGEFGVQYGLRNVDNENVTSDWHPVPKKPVFRVSPEQVHKRQMFTDVRIRPKSESAATRKGKQRDTTLSFGKYFNHFPVKVEDFEKSIITDTNRLEFDVMSGKPLPVHYSATHSLQMNTNFKLKTGILPKDASKRRSTSGKNKHIYNIK